MAIVPMKHVTVLVPREDLRAFEGWLYESNVLHLLPQKDPIHERYASLSPETDKLRERVEKLSQCVEFCTIWGKKRSFLEVVLSAQTVATPAQLATAAERVDVDKVYTTVTDLKNRRDAAMLRIASLEKEHQKLAPFADLGVPLKALHGLTRTKLGLIRLTRTAHETLDRGMPAGLMTEKVAGDLLWLAWAQDDSESEDFVKALEGEKVEFPELDQVPAERIRDINTEIRSVRDKLRELELEAAMCPSTQDDVELALGYWESELHRAEDMTNLMASNRLAMVQGFIPAGKLASFTKEVESSYSGLVHARDPVPGESVPVLLKTAKVFRPTQILVRLFGVPDYFSIDPTAIIAVSFFIFFGLCFSDVVYGLMLMTIAWIMERKFGKNRVLGDFFRLLFYGGISTAIAGAFLGGWASDLPDYLGEGNFLAKLRDLVPHFNALSQPIIGLLAVIAIGIFNQYLGIALLMWRNWRRGDVKGALFDGGLWFIYLTGLLCLAPILFVVVPKPILTTGFILTGLGAVGLVATQGRNEPTMAGKLITGVVSLYGILGSYGATGFIADTLSYSRLLALGLTTGIVGMSFNILADILRSVPVAGGILFVAFLLFGHTFNFVMSIIGSFVHPMRLILLEFFGRFYESSGNEYRPFGVRSERIEISTGGN